MKIRNIYALLGAAVVFCLAGGLEVASAAWEVFMQVDGIDGEATGEGHTNWIEISDIAFKMRMPEQPDGRLRPGGIRLTKDVDASTPAMKRVISEASTLSVVRIEMQDTARPNPIFYEMLLSNVTIFMNWPVSDTNRLSEYLMLDYEVFEWSYTESGGIPTAPMYADPKNDRSGYTTSNIDSDLLVDMADPDDDNDGSPDWEEGLAGTVATDPDDFFRVTLIQKSATNAILEWSSKSNRVYEIYVGSSVDGPYVPSGTGPITDPNQGGTAREVPISAAQRFYRVVVRDQPYSGF